MLREIFIRWSVSLQGKEVGCVCVMYMLAVSLCVQVRKLLGCFCCMCCPSWHGPCVLDGVSFQERVSKPTFDIAIFAQKCSYTKQTKTKTFYSFHYSVLGNQTENMTRSYSTSQCIPKTVYHCTHASYMNNYTWCADCFVVTLASNWHMRWSA